MTHFDSQVAIVGGGLGGLTAAALLAQRGLKVTLLERARDFGGRAATSTTDGFCFNMGAHALYRGGAASRVLARVGARWTSNAPPQGGLAVLRGRCHALPTTIASTLTTSLFGWSSKMRAARALTRLRSADVRALDGLPLAVWLQREESDVRALIEAFARLSTYANAPGQLSAGAAISQMRLAQRGGVSYVDGGWHTLVDSVAEIARAAGARLRPSARVLCASGARGGWRVHVEDSSDLTASALVLAVGPLAARSIVTSESLADVAHSAIPLHAACLDVALRCLPNPRACFALGVDRPLYLSVHSRVARVAPPGSALVSTMKYSSPAEAPDPARDQAELEEWLDLLQPGWRTVLLHRRWLPRIVASNALVTARGGGVAGRPASRIGDSSGVFVVGDWVGGEGMLLDASLASAEAAAEGILRDLAGDARAAEASESVARVA